MKETNDSKLEKILESIAKESKPTKDFEQILKVKLRERFHHLYENKEVKTSFFQRIWKLKVQFTSALVLVLFTSTTLYAYNTDEITNGHILYPLKRTAENVEELFVTSPEAKTNFYNKMAVRRMRELSVLENKGIMDEETIRETDNLLAKAEISAREVPDEEIEDSDENKQELKPLRPKNSPSIRANQPNDINLAKEQASIMAEVVTVEPRLKTKREKAVEEIAMIRAEFQQKFDRRLFKNEEKTEEPEDPKPTETVQPIIPKIEIASPIIKVETKPPAEEKLGKKDRPKKTGKREDKTRKEEPKAKKDDDNATVNIPAITPQPEPKTEPEPTPAPEVTITPELIITQPIINVPAIVELDKETEVETELYNLRELKRELKRLRVR